MQLTATKGISYTLLGVKPTRGSYGENLKRARERLSVRLGRKITQEEIAERRGNKRQGNLPAREKKPDVPRPETIIRDARAFECEPWELLDGIEFSYDELRRQPGETKETQSVTPGAPFQKSDEKTDRRSGTDRRLAANDE